MDDLRTGTKNCPDDVTEVGNEERLAAMEIAARRWLLEVPPQGFEPWTY